MLANFGTLTMTQQGLTLFAKAQSGTTLTFTRMQIGGGQLSGQNPVNMTALVTPIAYFSINTITTSGTTSLVTGIYTNTGLASSTYTCEIGIFANDPQAGEILYAYANAGTQGDTIPPASAGPLSKQFQISIAVGNATNVTANTPAQNYIPTTQIGAAGGVAPLNSSSVVPSANLPIATASVLGAVKAGTNISAAADGTISVPSFPWSGLTSKPTTISGYGITDNLVGSLTGGNNIAVINPTGLGTATVSITGVIPIANGGTGSSTQNFVDLTTAQTITGQKTFVQTGVDNGLDITNVGTLHLDPNAGNSSFNPIIQAGDLAVIGKGANSSNGNLVIAPWSSSKGGIRLANNGAVNTANNTIDNGSTGAATFASTVNAVGGFQWNGTNMVQTRLFNNKLQFWNGTGWQYAMGYGSGQYKNSYNGTPGTSPITVLSVSGMGALRWLWASGSNDYINVIIDGVTVISGLGIPNNNYVAGSGGVSSTPIAFDLSFESSLVLQVYCSSGSYVAGLNWVYELV